MSLLIRYSKLALLLCLAQPASALPPDAPAITSRESLSADQVVENMVRMNLQRALALQNYQGTRVYRLQYRGFPGARSAEMVVGVKYESPGTKEFTIQSATGSKIIIDKVFKKLLQSEKEALEAENQTRNALTTANYHFTMVGYEASAEGSAARRPMYLLAVEPKTQSKFLYRGRIWVDAEDFAVARIEAEPAKNPSFWIKNTHIEHQYVKVKDFWLPATNHSATVVRLGGYADLEIEYKDYRITAASPLGNSSSMANAGR